MKGTFHSRGRKSSMSLNIVFRKRNANSITYLNISCQFVFPFLLQYALIKYSCIYFELGIILNKCLKISRKQRNLKIIRCKFKFISKQWRSQNIRMNSSSNSNFKTRKCLSIFFMLNFPFFFKFQSFW